MKLNKNIALSESGFVFNPTTGDSFSTNRVGIDIIQHLQAAKKDKDIIKLMVDKYDIEINVFEKDLQDFYGVLIQYGLMESE